jgi:DNA-directed RNA polymerase subunit L
MRWAAKLVWVLEKRKTISHTGFRATIPRSSFPLVRVKAKESLYSTEQALRVPGD